MSTARTGATTSPRVAAYLADLERRLAGAPAADRLDVLDAVHEHLEAAFAELGPAPSDDDVRRVLADLGSPDEVAGALALDETPPPAGEPAQRTSVGVWVLLVLAGLVGGMLVAPVVVVLGIVHPAVTSGGLALLVAATAWVGHRAYARRAPEPRRPWQLAFAVVLPGSLVAGSVLLGAGLFLTSGSSVEEGTVVTTVVEG